MLYLTRKPFWILFHKYYAQRLFFNVKRLILL
jgi:hypothetical protein